MPNRLLAAVAALSFVVPVAVLAQDPVPRYPDNYKVLVENDRVRVLDFRLRKGDTEEFHMHPAHVLYVLAPFSEPVTHSPTNIGDTDAHGILVELKGQTALPATAEAGAALGNVLTAVTFIEGRPGSSEDVKRELLSLTAPTRAESGAIAYDLYQSVDRPGRFMRIEVWRDASALEAHKLTPHLKASFERRKNAGWMTEITRWERVPEEVPEERAALAR